MVAPAKAGVCSESLPWAATRVKGRIKVLNKEFQDAKLLHVKGEKSAYERAATSIYGLLRESWARALEEVLLGGVVERFSESIQTGQIKKIADITDDDCLQLEMGMTQCSKWLTGHDQASAQNEPIPEPDELQGDIDALKTWVAAVNGRR